jgi:flap endonuclease-1
MGIKELNPFLNKNAPSGIQEFDLCFYKGKSIAIDTSIYLYKYLYGNGNHLERFFQQIYRLRLNQITPIYIFDGKPPPQKNNEILHRQNRKQAQQEKLESLKIICEQNQDDKILSVDLKKEIKKMEYKMIRVTKHHILDLKYMFNLLNVKYIQAENCEADVICSQLCKNGVVDMILSDDMDLLVGGANLLLRNFSINSNKITSYDVTNIRNILKLSYDQWVDFCILCGCDYLKRIRGLGPQLSYKYILKYGNIESILEFLKTHKKCKIPENYNYEKARELFNSADGYKEEYNNIVLSMEDLFENQLNNIRKYLLKNTRFDEKQLNDRLKIIYNL